ncbi:MAG: helix-turn-helix domain-containing protein [Synergistaceae bacterium]|nr:helix-turn-helix domain-containing protein [Synergistaceae bacterium]MBR0150120.1 helix-turn-helix domain-containing protein [Synergistaceae bacterium]MBR0258558.1 helix-turn-helix domain-containing protein [Synergistaceae bacterium]
MAISSNIRRVRKNAGFTQIELAAKMGISIATLRRWEAGETTPTGSRMMELAELLGVSPEEIVGEDEQSKRAGRAYLPADERSGGMLVFEAGGTRIELPPTDKGYEIFNRLVENMMTRKAPQQS